MATQRFEAEHLQGFRDPEVQRLANWCKRHFDRVSDNLQGIDRIRLFKRSRAPDKVEDGMIVLADGTNWNPGSGAGYYGYNAGAWHFLG